VTDVPIGRVSPFGHRGIKACVPLPRAYRSLPRPSSPLCAQASPTYVRSLDSIPWSSKARAIFERVTRLQTGPFGPDRYYASLRFFVPCPFRRMGGYPRSLPRPLSNSASHQRDGNQREIGMCKADDKTPGLSGRRHRGDRPTHRSGKEVIQPQVPLRLPCYDFAPVTALAFGGLAPCGFRHRLRALTASMA
jgi:hypothetical protein